MTYEALIHALGRETPRMTRELLNIATLYANDEEPIQANFSSKVKAAGHLSGGDGGDDPASSQRCHDKQNNDPKCHEEEMVAMVDHAARPQPHGRGACLEHSEMVL